MATAELLVTLRVVVEVDDDGVFPDEEGRGPGLRTVVKAEEPGRTEAERAVIARLVSGSETAMDEPCGWAAALALWEDQQPTPTDNLDSELESRGL